MDMTEFEMTSSAVFLQLRHPEKKTLLFDQMPNPDETVGGTIDNPDMPVGVEIFSADSEQFKRHRRVLQNKAIKAGKNRNAEEVTAEEIEKEGEKTLAACIAKIVNMSWKGQVLEAPRDSLTLVKAMPWAADQIDLAMADRARFMPALSKNF